MSFNIEKNGYNKEEVELYIDKLNKDYQNELEEKRERINFLKNKLDTCEAELKKFKTKDENISVAMISAVEKAKQVEETSNNMYKLKLQQLNILYNRWESLLTTAIEKYPNLKNENQEIKNLVSDFRKSIDSTVQAHGLNYSSDNKSNDKIKVLLNKMNKYFADRKQENQNNEDNFKVSNDEMIKQPNIKPISNINIEEGENFDSIADKYLSSEDVDEQGIFKSNEEKSEFDLKEAVNPKDDLAEIMKAFDFYE